MKKYILFSGEFVQQSALSISGSEVEANFIDSFFARDGKNRLTIPGSSIAGSIVSFAYKMGFDFENDFSMTAKMRDKKKESDKQKEINYTSLMRVFNAHCDESVKCEVRQMNGLIQKTRAAAEEKSALFNVECTPVGTRWPFLIEVDISDKEGKGLKVAGILAKVLDFWSKKFGFLGGLTSRGMGWVKIENLKTVEVDSSVWPDSSQNEVVKYGSKLAGKKPQLNPVKPDKSDWKYKHITGTVKAGARTDGYGIDSLMIGGSEYTRWDFDMPGVKDKIEHPKGLDKNIFLTGGDHNVKSADHFFVISNYKGGQHPIIPGSSIKGAFRHFLSAEERKKGETVADPNEKKSFWSEKENKILRSLYLIFFF